nr:MAG TPA: hypothetical protein [Caudoviricetes sp.]
MPNSGNTTRINYLNGQSPLGVSYRAKFYCNILKRKENICGKI